ncbi:MAG TPA: nucleoside 2-deoxyribosyltransferase [Vicinamibacterales bacterium]|nr:nucleoside 2-deoxyribosyltransferase [Vicinamibacterales bacterium]
MPFDEGFDEIYGLFIAGTLTQAGYEVARADDIRNQQNILKDILAGITESDLVVADLTGSNPNVYYELGLAHALGKRVILLTQEMDDLPFDLRSYRVIPYSTHFAEVANARTHLLAIATDALEGLVVFGSPVSDFVAVTATRQPTISAILSSEPSDGEPGVLDHLVDLEEGFAKLNQIVSDTTAEMNSISEATLQTGTQLTSLAESGSPAQARRVVVMGLATKLWEFGKSLSTHNEQYAATLATTRSSLESLIRAQKPKTDEEKNQLRIFLEQLDRAEKSTRRQRNSLGELIEIIRSTPRVERTFNRAADTTVRSLEGYAQNVDQTLSMIVRARELANSRLDSAS